MSGSVPLITDPRNQLLETLPFVCTRASNQCHNAVRRIFDDKTSEQTNVTVMLHLVTRNGPTLMEMIANVVRNERDDRQREEVRVMLIGREVDPSLAGLLRHCNNNASATESDVTLSETNHDEDRYRSVSEKSSVKSDDAGAKGIFHEVPNGARAHDEDRQNVYEDPAERVACAALARVRRLNGRGGSDSTISSITLPSSDCNISSNTLPSFLNGSKPSSLSSIMLSPFRGGSKSIMFRPISSSTAPSFSATSESNVSSITLPSGIASRPTLEWMNANRGWGPDGDQGGSKPANSTAGAEV